MCVVCERDGGGGVEDEEEEGERKVSALDDSGSSSFTVECEIINIYWNILFSKKNTTPSIYDI